VLKRLFDLATVLLSAPLWLPLLAVLALLIRIKMGSPVVFSQQRGGLNNQSFKLYKLRTMTDARDVHGELLPDAERITRLGQFLRDTSLDELPSLLNLLKGDLSLVGPRPFIADYLPLYSVAQRRRHEVKPGITGWAQINGRNTISWEEKFTLDVWYVENHHFILDLKILWLTAARVLKRDNINADGITTMPRFTGTPDTKSS